MSDNEKKMINRFKYYIDNYERIYICRSKSTEAEKLKQRLRSDKTSIVVELESGEINDFLKLYYMYEFSDHILWVDRSAMYGSLQNYVDTGVITEEEFYDSLITNRK